MCMVLISCCVMYGKHRDNSISRARHSGNICNRTGMVFSDHRLICLIVMHLYFTLLCDVKNKNKDC